MNSTTRRRLYSYMSYSRRLRGYNTRTVYTMSPRNVARVVGFVAGVGFYHIASAAHHTFTHRRK